MSRNAMMNAAYQGSAQEQLHFLESHPCRIWARALRPCSCADPKIAHPKGALWWLVAHNEGLSEADESEATM